MLPGLYALKFIKIDETELMKIEQLNSTNSIQTSYPISLKPEPKYIKISKIKN